MARKAFKVNDSMKDIFVQKARESGWSINVCEGEADVTIGGLQLSEHDVVVSGDSDLFFYPGVHRVLRPMKRGIFHMYVKPEVLQTLKLTSLQWQCLGIVSGNDYDPNIRGMGIGTNYAIIQSIEWGTIKETVESYLLHEEVKKKNKNGGAFQIASKVFGTATQELITSTDSKNDEEQEIQDIKTVRSRVLRVRKRSKIARIENRNQDSVASESLLESQLQNPGNIKGKPKPNHVDILTSLRQRRKWHYNRCRVMENKRGRYAAKHFNMVKTRTVLQSGYDMYTANPPETATDDKPKPKRRHQYFYRALKSRQTKAQMTGLTDGLTNELHEKPEDMLHIAERFYSKLFNPEHIDNTARQHILAFLNRPEDSASLSQCLVDKPNMGTLKLIISNSAKNRSPGADALFWERLWSAPTDHKFKIIRWKVIHRSATNDVILASRLFQIVTLSVLTKNGQVIKYDLLVLLHACNPKSKITDKLTAILEFFEDEQDIAVLGNGNWNKILKDIAEMLLSSISRANVVIQKHVIQRFQELDG
ncbi:hypothetical protein Unana1_05756 [Umbelopsis nana]